jgi:FkbM family methyltransferase
MKSKLKRFFLSIKQCHIRKNIVLKSIWAGNKYGGFYFIPELLGEKSIIYSFGVGKDISFDKDLIHRFKCQVFAFDPTPESIEWSKKQKFPVGFNFFEFGIAKKSKKSKFFLPNNNNHVSGSLINHSAANKESILVQMKSFNDIVKLFNHAHVDLIKIDIEGAEYNIIDDILSSGTVVDQIVLEVHERFFSDGRSKTKKLLSSLSQNRFFLHSVSDSYEELSFIHDRAIKQINK